MDGNTPSGTASTPARSDVTVIVPPPPASAPPPPPSPTRRTGLSAAAWIGIAIGAVAVITAFVLLILSPWARSGEDPAAERRDAYMNAVAAPLDELGLSARRVGTALRDVDGADDLAPLARMATEEAARVDGIRADLQDIGVAGDLADANSVLVDATGLHADYLRVLARAASQPAEVALGLAGRVDAQGVRVADGYRGFHELLPEAVEPLAGVDLSQTAGLVQALQVIPPSEKRDTDPGAL